MCNAAAAAKNGCARKRTVLVSDYRHKLVTAASTGWARRFEIPAEIGTDVLKLDQGGMRNILLRSMAPEDFKRIAPDLRPVDLPLGMLLAEAGEVYTHVHFPERGVASVIGETTNGHSCEVGLFGFEGYSNTGILCDWERAVFGTVMQLPGDGHRLPVATLAAALAESPTLWKLLARYSQAFLVQVSTTAISNAVNTIIQRLARWLLMSLDRGESNEMVLTHEFLAIMLGVRRAGVTVALQHVEGRGLISTSRGVIRVLDRAGLVTLSAGSYGVAEAEYRRMIGQDPRAPYGVAAAA